MVKKKTPQGPSIFSLAGEFVGNKLNFYLELMEDYGDIVKLPFLSRTYLVNNAEMLKYILKDNPENYIRKGFVLRPLQLTLGNGLLKLVGAEWRKRRKSFSPTFQPKNIEHFSPFIQSITTTALQEWEKKFISNNLSVDINHAVLKIVYQVALKALFGQTTDENTIETIMAAINYENHFSMGFSSFFPWLPTLGVIRYRRAKTVLQKHINSLIEFGKQHPEDNFLKTLLHTSKADDSPLSEQDIFDEAKTFLMTGHETSGTAIAWAMYLVAERPEIQQKLKQELQTVLAGRLPDYDDLVNLPYTHAVFNESIRLFPPIWTTGRVCLEDDYIGEYFIRKNSKIIICPYTLHRRELYWDNPLEFQPERHLSESAKDRPMFAFIPFGGGPRICIASHFATMECVMIIAMIMQRYTIRLDENYPIELEPLISLKPKFGINVFVEQD